MNTPFKKWVTGNDKMMAHFYASLSIMFRHDDIYNNFLPTLSK